MGEGGRKTFETVNVTQGGPLIVQVTQTQVVENTISGKKQKMYQNQCCNLSIFVANFSYYQNFFSKVR